MAAMTVVCPHCKQKMKLRYSDTNKSERYKRITFQCVDPVCSYSELWEMTPKWGLSPSGNPDTELNLPFSPYKSCCK